MSSVVIAGGGTGGHVFPAIAVADALRALDANCRIVFVGTANGIEVTAVPKAGYELRLVDISGIKGLALSKKIRALWALPKAVFASIKMLRQIKPTSVLGVGGYASGPVLLAAFLLRIPTAILEPNSIAGFTNKFLGRFSHAVFGAFKRTQLDFNPQRFHLWGTPLRKEIGLPVPELSPTNHNRILVLGGSLGARAINEAMPVVIATLKANGLNPEVVHQTGQKEVNGVKESYEKLGIKADVRPFIDDMAKAYAWADLVICRSGATTCAELTAMGKASILIPFPYAIYDHQTLNARELVDAQAALLLPQSQMHDLAGMTHALLSDHARLFALKQRALGIAKRDAAQKIAASLLDGRFVLNNPV